ncbi:MAG: AAA family ATPase, partial [Bacteroidetes bacterium]|nr:AAA family ATPase [Bacteroidota bacterium]
SDTLSVKSLISNPITKFHPEAYRLTQPYSPHKSAAIDGIVIDPDNFAPPETANTLIIEGAGGLMVPLTRGFMIIDLIKKLQAEVVLVSKNYLGSINHTLLSIFALEEYGIPIKGIVFNGNKDIYTKDYILEHTGIALLGHIPHYKHVDKKTVIDSGEHIHFAV